MTKKELTGIAVKFHHAIIAAKEDAAFAYKDRMSRFPEGCCDDTADLFTHYLYTKYGIVSTRIDASYHDGNPENNCSHSWQEIDDIVIDLTGSQFKNDRVFLNYNKEVYVGPIDAFHELFEIDRKERSRGIEDLSVDCWDRMYHLYDTIIRFLEVSQNTQERQANGTNKKI